MREELVWASGLSVTKGVKPRVISYGYNNAKISAHINGTDVWVSLTSDPKLSKRAEH